MKNRLFYWCPLVVVTLLSTQVSAFTLPFMKPKQNRCDVIFNMREKEDCWTEYGKSDYAKKMEKQAKELAREQERKNQKALEKEKDFVEESRERQVEDAREREILDMANDIAQERVAQENAVNYRNENNVYKTFFYQDLQYKNVPYIAVGIKSTGSKEELTLADAMCKEMGFDKRHPDTKVDITDTISARNAHSVHLQHFQKDTAGYYIPGKKYKRDNVKPLDGLEIRPKYRSVHFFARLTCMRAKMPSDGDDLFHQNMKELSKAEIQWDSRGHYKDEIDRIENGGSAQTQSQSNHSKYQ